MSNPNDEIIRQLERDFPGWQVWVVPHYVGPDVWCARRHDDHKWVLNANSAAELEEYLDEASPGEGP